MCRPDPDREVRRVTIRRLVGAALTVPGLIGGLMLVTARPAAACSCAVMSEARKAAYADAIFVGTLIDRRIGEPTGAVTSSTHMAVWTFEVSRAYKGTVSKRQEIATAMSGASCGLELSGPGPFLVFARRPNDAVARAGGATASSIPANTSRTCASGHEQCPTAANQPLAGYHPARQHRPPPLPQQRHPRQRRLASRLASERWPRWSRLHWDWPPSGRGVGPTPTKTSFRSFGVGLAGS